MQKEQEVFSIKDKLSIMHIVDKFDPNKFINIISHLNEGKLLLNNSQYLIDGSKEVALQSMDHEGWKFVDLVETADWPAHLLYCSGKQVFTLLKDLKGLNELIFTEPIPITILTN